MLWVEGRFLHLQDLQDLQGWITGGGCPMHCRMLAPSLALDHSRPVAPPHLWL